MRRSSTNKYIFGVFGGLSEHFGIDASILRALGLCLLIFTHAPIVILYLIAAIVMPKQLKWT